MKLDVIKYHYCPDSKTGNGVFPDKLAHVSRHDEGDSLNIDPFC